MQTKIAVIGDRASVMGYKAVGFQVFEVEGTPSIADLVKSMDKEGFGIIFVTEELIEANPDVVEKYKESMLPAIIPVPGRKGSLNIGMDNIHRNVERAVGADIFNN